jgi:hypothetical protein
MTLALSSIGMVLAGAVSCPAAEDAVSEQSTPRLPEDKRVYARLRGL